MSISRARATDSNPTKHTHTHTLDCYLCLLLLNHPLITTHTKSYHQPRECLRDYILKDGANFRLNIYINIYVLFYTSIVGHQPQSARPPTCHNSIAGLNLCKHTYNWIQYSQWPRRQSLLLVRWLLMCGRKMRPPRHVYGICFENCF